MEGRELPGPPDLQRWVWTMQQMKSGPRKHPGGWHQVIFWRLHGLAKEDDELDLQDESLRVKVRRSTLDEALAEAIRQMRDRSASLEPSEEYDRRMDEHQRMWEEHMRRARKHVPGDTV